MVCLFDFIDIAALVAAILVGIRVCVGIGMGAAAAFVFVMAVGIGVAVVVFDPCCDIACAYGGVACG